MKKKLWPGHVSHKDHNRIKKGRRRGKLASGHGLIYVAIQAKANSFCLLPPPPPPPPSPPSSSVSPAIPVEDLADASQGISMTASVPSVPHISPFGSPPSGERCLVSRLLAPAFPSLPLLPPLLIHGHAPLGVHDRHIGRIVHDRLDAPSGSVKISVLLRGERHVDVETMVTTRKLGIASDHHQFG